MLLLDLAEREKLLLQDMIDDAANQLKKYSDLPDKTLVYRARGLKEPDYYAQEYKNGKKILDPLGKADSDSVNAYKMQRFLDEKLKVLQTDFDAVQQLLSTFKDYSRDAIQQNLPAVYQNAHLNQYLNNVQNTLSSFGHLPDNIVNDPRFKELVDWAHADYKRNPMPLPEDPNIARDGTPMRSKGECMWYDNILFEGLPVRVEPEIVIQGISGQWHKLYPDFEFLCFDGSHILTEQYGGWGDEKYAERNKRKFQVYLDCKFVLGDNLIVTSDNAYNHTNELAIINALELIKKRMFA